MSDVDQGAPKKRAKDSCSSQFTQIMQVGAIATLVTVVTAGQAHPLNTSCGRVGSSRVMDKKRDESCKILVLGDE